MRDSAAVKWRLNGSLAVSSNLFEYLLSQCLVLSFARNEAARLALPRVAPLAMGTVDRNGD